MYDDIKYISSVSALDRCEHLRFECRVLQAQLGGYPLMHTRCCGCKKPIHLLWSGS